MPIQKSDSFTAVQPVPVVTFPPMSDDEIAELEAIVELAPAVCGHVNKHYTGADVMACVLPKGHAGNHEAPYVNRGMVEIGAWNNAVDQ
jgi:hypothetical protein